MPIIKHLTKREMTLYNKPIKQKLSLYIGIVLTILALAYQEFLTHIELGIHDEPWHIANCRNPEEYPMIFLPYIIGNWFGNIFGFSFFAFRHFALCINLLSLAIALIPLLRNNRYKTAIWISGLMIWGILQPNLWGYDCVGNIFLATCIVCLYYFYHSKEESISLIISISSLATLYSLCRFPNILIIPWICFYFIAIGIYRSKGIVNSIRNLLTFLLPFTIIYYTIPTLYFDNFSVFIDGLLTSTIGEATSANHNLRELIISYIYWHAPRILLGSVYVAILGLLLYITHKISDRHHISHLVSYSSSSILCIICTILYLKIVNDNWNNGLHWLRNGIYFLIAILSILRLSKNGNWGEWTIFIIFILGVSAIPAAGSNTGLMKVASILTIPILLSEIPFAKERRIYLFFALLFIAQTIHNLYYYYEKGDEHGKGWKYTTEHVLCDKVDVYTIPYAASAFNPLIEDLQIAQQNKGNVLFIGGQRFLYNYIANIKCSAKLHTYYEDINNIEYQQAIVEHINKYQCNTIYVVNEYHKPKEMSDEQLQFHATADSLLQANGFAFVKYINNTGYKKYRK